jgi:hypothetical protein
MNTMKRLWNQYCTLIIYQTTYIYYIQFPFTFHKSPKSEKSITPCYHIPSIQNPIVCLVAVWNCLIFPHLGYAKLLYSSSHPKSFTIKHKFQSIKLQLLITQMPPNPIDTNVGRFSRKCEGWINKVIKFRVFHALYPQKTHPNFSAT